VSIFSRTSPARPGSIWGGVALAAVVFAASWHAQLSSPQCWTAAITCLCAVWWLFESIPIPATSLVPFALFPIAGVLDHKEVARSYGDWLILLFLGGFMLSKAAEHSGAHRQIARAMFRVIGSGSGRQVVLAFMLATAVCSMWISNTATTLMMLPVALAVLERETTGKLAVPLMLGIAYSASIGGLATPIGTPPNGVFLSVYEATTGRDVPFPQWMLLAGVVSLIMLVVAWIVLTARLPNVGPVTLPPAGRWTPAQRRTLLVFGLAAAAWICRKVPWGGWSAWLDLPMADDSTVALLAAVSLFIIPSGEGSGRRLLDWPTAVKIPWGILLLFGGGLAIANAFKTTGLSTVIGAQLVHLRAWPPVAVIGTVCLTVTFLTEVTSNTATASVLLPVLAAAAAAAHMDPALLMVPATLSASCAFMLPVATAPNALVFSSEKVRIADMARAGLVLNLVGTVIITLVCWKLLPVVFAVTVGP